MSSSVYLEHEDVAELTGKIVQARRLYGSDSSYVIGLISGIEWLLDRAEGTGKLKEAILNRIMEGDGEKPSRGTTTEASSGSGVASAGETLEENTWIKGIVKWFNNDKGYGFISTDSHIDVFVHWRDISSWDRSLAQGDEVEFMVTRTAKGFQAINVMKAGQEKGKEEGGDNTEAGTVEESSEEETNTQELSTAEETAEENPAGGDALL